MKLYIRYNDYRKEKFKLKTVINEEKSKLFTYKKANRLSKNFLLKMFQNYNNLRKENLGFKLTKCKKTSESKLKFEFINNKKLDSLLLQAIKDNDKDKFLTLINDFKIQITKNNLTTCKTNEKFKKIFGKSDEVFQECLKIGIFDLNFDNLFVDNKKNTLIDYEWIFDFQIPYKYIIFRALMNFYSANYVHIPKNFLKISDVLKKLDISKEEIERFIKYEFNFYNYVFKKEYKNLNEFKKNFENILENKNLLTQKKAIEETFLKDYEIKKLNNTINLQNQEIEKLKTQKDEIKKEYYNTVNSLRWKIPNKIYNIYKNKIKHLIPKFIFKPFNFLFNKQNNNQRREFSVNFLKKKIVNNKNNIFIIDHLFGGGSNLYSNILTNNKIKKGDGVFSLRYDINQNKYRFDYQDKKIKKEFIMSNIDLIKEIFKKYNIKKIFINELFSFPNLIKTANLFIEIKIKHKIKIETAIHDYFFICPTYTLLDYQNSYCGIPKNLSECQNCIQYYNEADFLLFYKKSNINLKEWRNNFKNLLKNSNRIIFFSNISKKLLLKTYPNLEHHSKMIVKKHKVNYVKNLYKQKKHKPPFRIGILGTLNVQKGLLIFEEMLKFADKQNNKDLEFYIIGNPSKKIKNKRVKIHGKYEQNQLTTILKEAKIDLFFVPTVTPETFSYTAEEIMKMGYPIALFNHTAPAERARKYPKSIIINDVDPKEAYRKIKKYIKNNIKK